MSVKDPAHLLVLQLEKGIASFQIGVDRLDAGHFCGDFAGGGKLLAKALDLCKACIHHGQSHSIKPPESLVF